MPASCSLTLPRLEPVKLSHERVDVLGCPVDALSFSETVEEIRRALRTRRSLRVVAINVDQVMKTRRDPAFAAVVRGGDVNFADGVPILWAAALLGHPLPGRVSGTDLVWECARISAEDGSSVSLVGGGPGVAEKAAARVRESIPGARLFPIPTPIPLGPSVSEAVVQRLRELDTAIVLVALGAPRQENWVARYLADSGAQVGIGVGSAFDIISGNQPRAPRWMRDHGLEWLHRLRLDPRRLAHRYLVEDSPFVLLVVFAAISRFFRRRA